MKADDASKWPAFLANVLIASLPITLFFPVTYYAALICQYFRKEGALWIALVASSIVVAGALCLVFVSRRLSGFFQRKEPE
jgi:hypothetical protein